ncbi:hypothetical protein B0O99DRAFT_221502 [Bisporella sp. PMI_857]|nr:hypothetical protein B0O99DRAFT_221502 [Bisporella sp. PMI_857]
MDTISFSVPRSKWKRQGAIGKQKTRGGCITCKARHVKCDEMKPYCSRCRQLARHCEGYSDPVRLKRKKTPTSLQPLRSIRPLKLKQPSHDLQELNETEGLYLQTFIAYVVPELSTGYSTNLWHRIVLQACHTDRSIRRAAVALGALGTVKKCMIYERGSDLYAMSKVQSSMHYENALRQYDYALNTMRQVLYKQPQGIRELLIACLLVILFEGFQGNLTAVVLHAESGCKILQDWKTKTQPREKFSVPSATQIENDIVQAFGRLNMHVTGAKWLRGQVHLPASLGTIKSSTTQYIPPGYPSIDEAYQGFEKMMADSIQVLCSAAVVFGGGPYLKSKAQLLEADRSNSQSPNNMTGSMTEYELEAHKMEMLAQIESHLVGMKTWLSTVQQMHLYLIEDVKRDLFPLEICIYAIQILLKSIGFRDEASMDVFMPEYKKIVTLAKASSLPAHRSSVMGMFCMDLGILPSLFVVVKGCRDPQIRREAIMMLFSTPRREGTWDSLFVARFGVWIMQEEERGMTDGYIPDWARIYVTKVDINANTKSASVEALSMGTDGVWQTKQSVIDWSMPMTLTESLGAELVRN